MNSLVLFQLFLHFLELLIPLEACEEELLVLRTRCEKEPDAGVALVDVKHARFEPIPVLLLQFIGVGEGPQDVAALRQAATLSPVVILLALAVISD